LSTRPPIATRIDHSARHSPSGGDWPRHDVRRRRIPRLLTIGSIPDRHRSFLSMPLELWSVSPAKLFSFQAASTTLTELLGSLFPSKSLIVKWTGFRKEVVVNQTTTSRMRSGDEQ